MVELRNNEVLVYTPSGKVAHIGWSYGVSADCSETRCKMSGSGWRGTGSQDEYEKASRLPLCKRCYPRGAGVPAT